MASEFNDEEEPATEALLAELERWSSARCAGCQAGLCGHQVLMNFALGFKDAPRCLHCLAIALGNPVDGLRDALIGYIEARECYRAAWQWASRREETAGAPACGLALSLSVRAGSASVPPEETMTSRPAEPVTVNADAEWDAGDMGCGDLVLELRGRLQSMASGRILKLSARDPGAREDLPAWCGLTGHRLVRAEPPNYWIQRKD